MRKKKVNTIRKDTSVKKKRIYKKKKIVSKIKVDRTRNAGTLTESQYFSKIRSGLRNTFRYWKPMMIALEKSSRAYVGPNKRQQKEYQCAECEQWFQRKFVEVDHVEECGSLKCYNDIISFIERLTREEPEAYRILCKPCHRVKTKKYLESKKCKND